jgi:hypothetical protein
MQSVSAAFRGLDVVAGSHGRIPIASHLLLPWDPRLEGSDAAETAALEQAYGSVEALAARGLFHPVTDKVAPLPLSELQAEEFQTVPVTGSRRFHVTCEGLLTWTYNRTGFDVSSWPERVAREYLLTFLLALTQAVTLQNISWRSYTRRDRRRDNEALIERFLDYSTDYDFAVVSQQFNIQRLYRCSRIALGVERIDKEVREELQAWIESETRKEQRSLNSIAVAALLGAVATVFVGLGVSNFNRDSNVAAWWGTSGPASPLWFWIPTLLVLAFSAVSRSVRRHLRRVWRLLWDR